MKNRTGVTIAAFATLLAPVALLIVFCAALCALRPDFIADEISHYPAIIAILHGDWAATRWLPMPPTYHALAAGATYLLGDSLVALRWFGALLGVLTIGVMWAIARALRPDDASVAPRAALNPLFISLCPLVYTDVLSLLLVLVGLWAHLRQRNVIASVALVAAMLVRQSNVVWPVLFLLLPAADALDAAPARSLRDVITRGAAAGVRRTSLPYALALVLGAVFVLVPNPLTSDIPPGNEPKFNVGLYYIWALAGVVLWLPLWIDGSLRGGWLARVGTNAAMSFLLLSAAFALAANFDNPHGWNTNPASLRNWPLLAMHRSRAVCFATCAVLVTFLLETARRTRQSGNRVRLLTIWATCGVFLAPHALVDPRYFVIPAALLDLFAPLERAESRRLAAWYAVLSIATIAMMLLRPAGLIHL